MLLAQGGQECRKEIRGDGGDDPEPERSGPGPGQVAGQVLQLVGLAQAGPGALEDLLPCGGDVDVAAIPIEEAHAESFLQLADLRTQGGLGYVAGLGGPPEVAVLGDRDRVFELPQRGAHD